MDILHLFSFFCHDCCCCRWCYNCRIWLCWYWCCCCCCTWYHYYYISYYYNFYYYYNYHNNNDNYYYYYYHYYYNRYYRYYYHYYYKICKRSYVATVSSLSAEVNLIHTFRRYYCPHAWNLNRRICLIKNELNLISRPSLPHSLTWTLTYSLFLSLTLSLSLSLSVLGCIR